MYPKPELSREIAKPLYRQVANYLRDRIADKTWSPGSALPSEKELTALLKVSRPTVRHAVEILVEEGLVERVPGRGSFVTEGMRPPRRSRSGNLALVGPEMRDSFLTRIVTGAEHVVALNDYYLIICNAGNQISVEQRYLKDLWEGNKVSGFIILPADSPHAHQLLRDFFANGVPIVLFDRYFEDLNVPYVVSDNFQGGYSATKHLIELGHRRIGFLSRPNLYVTSVAHRLQGYRRALTEAGIAYDSSLVFQGLLPFLSEIQVLERSSPRLEEYDRKAIKEFLSRPNPPSAIFACNDLIAAQVVEACREMGKRIPEDVALVGYDDDPVARLLTPPLTTVRQQTHEMGACAVTMLLDMLNGKAVEQQVILPVELMVRQSCGVDLRQDDPRREGI